MTIASFNGFPWSTCEHFGPGMGGAYLPIHDLLDSKKLLWHAHLDDWRDGGLPVNPGLWRNDLQHCNAIWVPACKRHVNMYQALFAHPGTTYYLPVHRHLYVGALVGDQEACRGINGSGHGRLADSLAVTCCQLATTICQKPQSKPLDKTYDDIDGFVHEKRNSNFTEECPGDKNS